MVFLKFFVLPPIIRFIELGITKLRGKNADYSKCTKYCHFLRGCKRRFCGDNLII